MAALGFVYERDKITIASSDNSSDIVVGAHVYEAEGSRFKYLADLFFDNDNTGPTPSRRFAHAHLCDIRDQVT